MQKFKVIALSIGGANNIIYRAGDEVTADAFPNENVSKLVKEGFLEEIELTDEELEAQALKDAEAAKEKQDALDAQALLDAEAAKSNSDENENSDAPLFDSVKDEEKSIPDFDLVTRNQLMEIATENNISFAQNISKKDLFDLVYKK